ncbi:MAG TPA: beta-ketoacyl synthase N-terminal-like domain-containing protein [Ohtaekwangia sp.]|uniref:beta-ketoacyl synthase N-terminal-like domain-containing protein n=1 Tax=Ohtaekwangia sp. TaxID=2066019 RepID=UPI002F936D62
MSRIFVTGMGNISPQKTWGDGTLLAEITAYTTDRLSCVEPDYSQWFDPRQLRRMSRVLKMGVASGSIALKEAGIAVPDAIITGTGYGCLEDTGIFLTKLVENHEEALNPTPFIQSTHNTIGSLIALQLQCQGYNQTYTQDAFSFESSLLDAILMIKEEPALNVLTGGVDEITDYSHIIQRRFGKFTSDNTSNLDLFKNENGIVNGEGSTYIVLSGAKKDYHVCVESVATLYKADDAALRKAINELLGNSGLTAKDIGCLLLGTSGNERHDKVLLDHADQLFPQSTVGRYKHLCGEHPVASAFAFWLGVKILQEQTIPGAILMPGVQAASAPENILIYNQYGGTHHSFILLKSCRDSG